MNLNRTKKVVGLILIAIVIGIGAFALNTKPVSAESILERLDLNDQELTSIVMALDERLDEPQDIGARITGEALLLYQGEDEVSVPLPEDLFFVSIAPYINDVHPCQVHNLITCRGELYGETMLITITLNDGSVLYSEERTTQANGFIGLWLPAGIEGTLSVEMPNRSVSYPISTYANSDTCITTPLKLLAKA